MSGPGPATAPPGWYPGPGGQFRWWTGTTWGAFAPPAPPAAPPGYGPPPGYGGGPAYGMPAPPTGRTDARTLAMVAQLSQLVGGFVVPLVLYLTAGKDDPFIRHHSAEALNFSITYLVASFATFALFFVGIFFPPLFIGLFVAWLAIIIGHLVLLVMASVAAYRGEWWRYPVCIRLVSSGL